MRKLLLLAALFLGGCGGLYGVNPLALPVVMGPEMNGVLPKVTDIDRMVAWNYYSTPEHRRKLRPLAPAHYMMLEPGEPIPRQVKTDGLPRDLERQMLPIPQGYKRVLVGDALVILGPEKRVVDKGRFFAGMVEFE
ncbi:MAG: hypothetical protein OEY97_08805 [Nitrospirota bacterium]|nr:hypothetical protein [Nitrospirota bacterium]